MLDTRRMLGSVPGVQAVRFWVSPLLHTLTLPGFLLAALSSLLLPQAHPGPEPPPLSFIC